MFFGFVFVDFFLVFSGMVKSALRATRDTNNATLTCILCLSATKNQPNICDTCFKRLEGIFANLTDQYDSALTAILRTTRKHHRDQSVRSLGNRLSGTNQAGAAKLETLKKENKVMGDKIRYLEKSKATWGFKSKEPKKTNLEKKRGKKFLIEFDFQRH